MARRLMIFQYEPQKTLLPGARGALRANFTGLRVSEQCPPKTHVKRKLGPDQEHR